MGDYAVPPLTSPTYHNHSQDYNSYTATSSSGPKSNTTTKVVEASEDEIKGYHTSSGDGRARSTYEERSKMRHLRENVTTATLIDGDQDQLKGKSSTTSVDNKSVPVIATETRKMAYTETKVCVDHLVSISSNQIK